MLRRMRWFLLMSWLVFQLGLPSHVLAQESEPAVEPPPVVERSLHSLRTIAEPLTEAIADLERLQADLREAVTEDAREEIRERIDAERERIRQLRDNFRDIVGGSEAAEYEGVTADGGGIQEQITDIVQPVLSSLRDATSKPRELEALRKSLEVWNERERKTETVLARIDDLIAAATEPALIAELQAARRLWSGRQSEASSQIAVLEVQIYERTRDQESVWETLSGGISDFFRSRGMNLLIAVLAGVISFIAARKLYFWVRRFTPLFKKDQSNIFSRLSDVLAMTFAILLSVLSVLFVFYVRGDWLLLTLIVIVIAGLAWAGKTALPPYLGQIRMILNLGPVREGERVIYQGVPWKVSSLGFYTIFTNPSLNGGHLRIPISYVMEMISRAPDPKERWFPTETDDWLILSDETFGKVISQSPEQVVVLQLGSSFKTYPTPEFLEMSPENLSRGFRVCSTFGIDYQHQAESTTSIPKIFASALNLTLASELGHEVVRSIKVEFSSASSSSLDYQILADFDGSLAPKYNVIRRRIQSICVDVCNEHGWIIPFTQVTLHQAQPE